MYINEHIICYWSLVVWNIWKCYERIGWLHNFQWMIFQINIAHLRRSKAAESNQSNVSEATTAQNRKPNANVRMLKCYETHIHYVNWSAHNTHIHTHISTVSIATNLVGNAVKTSVTEKAQKQSSYTIGLFNFQSKASHSPSLNFCLWLCRSPHPSVWLMAINMLSSIEHWAVKAFIMCSFLVSTWQCFIAYHKLFKSGFRWHFSMPSNDTDLSGNILMCHERIWKKQSQTDGQRICKFYEVNSNNRFTIKLYDLAGFCS